MFLETALNCIRRGWYVFPCIPRTKAPLGGLVPHGWHDASNDEATIRRWWTAKPDANVAIACGPSKIAVVDCDHGNASEADARTWMERSGLPITYTVHTGRRWDEKDPEQKQEYGVQLYYSGSMSGVGTFELCGGTGQVKSEDGYVMASGSIHPVSGEAYEELVDAALAPLPNFVRALKTQLKTMEDGGGPITENRNNQLTSIAGKLRNAGLGHDALEAALLATNYTRCTPPLDDEEVCRIADNASKWELPQPDVQVTIGGKVTGAAEPPKDWRTRYMTAEGFNNVREPEFLIDGFLVKKSMMMLAGPVSQRKSIVAMNIIQSLLTGNPLFDYFHVQQMPERVIYLCPEMNAGQCVKRLKQLELGRYVGKTLFCQTMDEESTPLDGLEEEVPNSVIIVDTITRFIEGDENKSEDMRQFAKKVFRIVGSGATVILLHHSKKGSSGTLDDGLRGSSEIAAFVDSCWVTELEDPKEPFKCLSRMRNVKQRDFQSDPMRLRPIQNSYHMTIEGQPGTAVELKDAAHSKDREIAAPLIRANPKMGVTKLVVLLRAAGVRRSKEWVTRARSDAFGGGVKLSS